MNIQCLPKILSPHWKNPFFRPLAKFVARIRVSSTSLMWIRTCVHSHYAAWRNAALPHGKSCSAYAAKLISSTLKKNFLLTIFQFTKTVDEKHVHIICHGKNKYLITVDGKYQHDKPLMRPTFC